ncbi:MAG: hypothetical protein QME63_08465 [Actinomycetota bacterium]|nr:hypothetical protein [Actinomycetota bacterium]
MNKLSGGKKYRLFVLIALMLLGTFLIGFLLMGTTSDRETDMKEIQEIERVVGEYYDLLFTGDVWPDEYRHLKKVPDDVKKKIYEDGRARALKLTAGEHGKMIANIGGLITTYEELKQQKIGGGSKVLLLEDIEFMRPEGVDVSDKVRLNAVIWSWIQEAHFNEAKGSFVSTAKTDSVFIDELVLQKIGDSWKIIKRTSPTPLINLKEELGAIDGKGEFGPPTLEEAKQMYNAWRQQQKPL